MPNDNLINLAMNEILKPVSNVKITIGEKLFVKKYLPLLIDFEDRRTFIEMWLEVCKNPYYPVDVLNDNGEVLFAVPPIWIRQKTKVDYDGKYSLGEVLTRAQKRAEIAPKQGDKFFDECLPYIVTESSDDTDYTKVWKSILVRYGHMEDDTKINENLEEDFEFVDF